MSYTATTISEHIWNEGKIEGKIEGKVEGKMEGKMEGKVEGVIEGQIKILESLYLSAVLRKEQFEMMVEPLRKQLEKIQCAL